jgi:hypothetical protein
LPIKNLEKNRSACVKRSQQRQRALSGEVINQPAFVKTKEGKLFLVTKLIRSGESFSYDEGFGNNKIAKVLNDRATKPEPCPGIMPNS